MERKAHKSSVRGQDGTHISYSNTTNQTQNERKRRTRVRARDDLEEMMAMAQLSNRVPAERERCGGPVVVSTEVVGSL